MATPQDIMREGADTYESKNDDYGDSWRKVGETMFQMANEQPVTLESAEDYIRLGLYTRRLDKLFRSFNGEFVADDLNFETVQDSHEDEAVYAAMHASTFEDETVEETDDVGVEIEREIEYIGDIAYENGSKITFTDNSPLSPRRLDSKDDIPAFIESVQSFFEASNAPINEDAIEEIVDERFGVGSYKSALKAISDEETGYSPTWSDVYTAEGEASE